MSEIDEMFRRNYLPCNGSIVF